MLEKATLHFIEDSPCPTCRSNLFTRFMRPMPDLDAYGDEMPEPFRSAEFEFVRCSRCETIYLRSRVIPSEIGRYYSGEYHCYKSYNERGRIFNFLAQLLLRSKISLIRKLMPQGNSCLLDYGCGSGTWLQMIKQSGSPWSLIGTDIVPDQIEIVRSMGIKGYVSDESTLTDFVKPGSVGVVHMFHVIEHIPDPIRALRKLREVLVPGGAILGQTPNFNSWDRSIFGRYWSQWHAPRHLTLYTPDLLKRHAEAAGLEFVAVRNSLVGATNWSNSVLKATLISRGRTYEPGKGILYPLLTLAAIPIAMLQSLISCTSSVDFIFKRPEHE